MTTMMMVVMMMMMMMVVVMMKRVICPPGTYDALERFLKVRVFYTDV
jgi:hypothetical protein